MGSFLALIIRLIVMNPTVIAGVLLGCYYTLYLHYNQTIMLLIAQTPVPYLIALGLAFLYALLVKHVYHPNTQQVNWWATLKSVIGHFFTIIFAAACTVIIILSCDLSNAQSLDDYLRYKKK